jgi:hypothetical protein
MALLGMSVGIGFTTGVLTGIIMRLPIFEQLEEEEFFDDEENFEIPDEGFAKQKSKVEEINENSANGFNGFNPNVNSFNPGNFFPPGGFFPPPV